MTENIKSSAALFLKIVVVMVMSFFLSISTSILCVAAFTDVAGYTAYGTKEGENNSTELYTYYYSEGEDLNEQKYVDEGYTITKSTFRSELDGIGKKVYSIGTQSIVIIILFAFIYTQLWKLGNKDHQNVKLGKIREDKLRGLKIGLLASAPQFISFLCLIFVPKFKTAIYMIVNYHYFMINDSIIGKVKLASGLGITDYIYLFLPFLIVPILTALSYIVGYKDISLSEKFVYKKVD